MSLVLTSVPDRGIDSSQQYAFPELIVNLTFWSLFAINYVRFVSCLEDWCSCAFRIRHSAYYPIIRAAASAL